MAFDLYGISYGEDGKWFKKEERERLADERETTRLMGKELKSVEVLEDGTKIKFRFLSHPPISYLVDAGCCSHSWVEHFELPDNVSGAKVVQVISQFINAFDEVDGDAAGQFNEIKVYSTTFRTTAGDIVFEYRNSSNGAYGAELRYVENE